MVTSEELAGIVTDFLEAIDTLEWKAEKILAKIGNALTPDSQAWLAWGEVANTLDNIMHVNCYDEKDQEDFQKDFDSFIEVVKRACYTLECQLSKEEFELVLSFIPKS